jgi:hypothetical protein
VVQERRPDGHRSGSISTEVPRPPNERARVPPGVAALVARPDLPAVLHHTEDSLIAWRTDVVVEDPSVAVEVVLRGDHSSLRTPLERSGRVAGSQVSRVLGPGDDRPLCYVF